MSTLSLGPASRSKPSFRRIDCWACEQTIDTIENNAHVYDLFETKYKDKECPKCAALIAALGGIENYNTLINIIRKKIEDA